MTSPIRSDSRSAERPGETGGGGDRRPNGRPATGGSAGKSIRRSMVRCWRRSRRPSPNDLLDVMQRPVGRFPAGR